MAGAEAPAPATMPATAPVSAPLGVLRGLAGLVLVAMVGLNVVNAAGRYTIGFVFVGADELLVYSMVWMVMVGAVVAVAERSQLALDVLTLRLEGRARAGLLVFQELVMAAACGYAAWQSLMFTLKIGRLGQTSMGLGVPMAIPHAALFAGFAGMAVVAVVLTVRDAVAFATVPSGAEARR
jgi:TRAP-type C4-dicarboxylate transport system permease small subunit